MSVPSKAIPYPADVNVSGPAKQVFGPAEFQEWFDFSPVPSTSTTSSIHSSFQDLPSSPPVSESSSSHLQDDNMDVDNSESDDLQSGRPQDMQKQIREQTAQMEKLITLVEELEESSSSLCSSPEATSSESVGNYAPDLGDGFCVK